MQSSFFDAVESRRAVRKFLAEPVPGEVVERCLAAAMKAPSSSMLQPWEFVLLADPAVRASAAKVCLGQSPAVTAPLLVAVVAHQDTWRRNSEEIVRVLRARGLADGTREKYWRRKVPFLYTCGPLGVFGGIKKLCSRLLSLWRPSASWMSAADRRVVVHKGTALAAAIFMLALRAEGYDTCPMEGYDPWRARKLLRLSKGTEVCLFIAVGKRAPEEILQERILMPRPWMVRWL